MPQWMKDAIGKERLAARAAFPHGRPQAQQTAQKPLPNENSNTLRIARAMGGSDFTNGRIVAGEKSYPGSSPVSAAFSEQVTQTNIRRVA